MSGFQSKYLFVAIVSLLLVMQSNAGVAEDVWGASKCPVYQCTSLSRGKIHLLKEKAVHEFENGENRQNVSLKGPQCFVYFPVQHTRKEGAISVRRVIWPGTDQADGKGKVFFNRHQRSEHKLSSTKYTTYHTSKSFSPLKLYRLFHMKLEIQDNRDERTDRTSAQRDTFKFERQLHDDPANLEKVTLIKFAQGPETCVEFVLNTSKQVQTWEKMRLLVHDLSPSELASDIRGTYDITLENNALE